MQCVLVFVVIHFTVLGNFSTPLFMIDELIHLEVDSKLNNRYNIQDAKCTLQFCVMKANVCYWSSKSTTKTNNQIDVKVQLFLY
jgi:hypothetical protein